MKKTIRLTTIALTTLVISTGCVKTDINVTGDVEMSKLTAEMIVEKMLREEFSDEDFNALELSMQNTVVDLLSHMMGSISEEEIERQRAAFEEHRRTNLEYIIRGPYTPPADDVGLHDIKRFVFTHGDRDFGIGLVVDKLSGRIFFDPNAPMGGESILPLVFSEKYSYVTEIIDKDLERIIQAIEDVDPFSWEVRLPVERDPDWLPPAGGGGTWWTLGIEFNDRTILRRNSGGHMWTQEQFDTLYNFVRELGQEIIDRAEFAANE